MKSSELLLGIKAVNETQVSKKNVRAHHCTDLACPKEVTTIEVRIIDLSFFSGFSILVRVYLRFLNIQNDNMLASTNDLEHMFLFMVFWSQPHIDAVF